LDKKNFIILFCSSNPYIERKTLIVQEQVDQTLRDYNLIEKGFTVRIEGVGCSFRTGCSNYRKMESCSCRYGKTKA